GRRHGLDDQHRRRLHDHLPDAEDVQEAGASQEMSEHYIHIIYMASAACFILALKWLSAVPTAKRGVITGIIGMLLAVGGTLLAPEIKHYLWILVAFATGGIIGVPMALMPMTAVPQRTALS